MEDLYKKPNHENHFGGKELSQELERQAEAGKLSSDLLRDFYQTFRLGQQVKDIQSPLFILLADQHRQAGHRDIMADALMAADDKVDDLRPPRGHGDTDANALNDPETGFRAMWTEYSKTLKDPDSGIRSPTELILNDMLAQELYYQENERPNRNGQDVHGSIVREYILRDRLTGSEQLMAVRDMLRSTLISPAHDGNGSWMTGRLQEVMDRWEENHPGESFMPPGDVSKPS